MTSASKDREHEIRGSGMSKSTSTALVAVVLLLLAFAPGASAFKVIAELGEGDAQTRAPEGLAIDFETKRLYVADTGNNRVSIFDATGKFLKAFGWGVKTGANELEVCTSKCRKGIAGDGRGQFNRPRAIAVDNDPGSPSFHNVYVVDYENLRVQKFGAEGNFILTFGGGVNKTKVGEGAPKAERDVCPVAPGDVCGKGSEGFGEGEFNVNSGFGRTGIFASIGSNGVVYVVDNYRRPDEFKSRLQRFDPSGTQIPPQRVLREGSNEVAQAFGLATDYSSGDFYVGHMAAIGKYEEDGDPIDEISNPFGDENTRHCADARY